MDHEQLKRGGAVLAPSLFTVGNMACGFMSLLSTSQNRFAAAAWFILIGIVFDMLDGKVARLVHGESKFGVEFDSLADNTTFGIAPAYLMYEYVLKVYGQWAIPVAFLFALCGTLRLARYNLGTHEDERPSNYFSGLPIPAAAGILASFVLLYDILEQDKPVRMLKILMREIPLVYPLIPFIMIGLSFLMISKIPYRAMKQPSVLRPRSVKTLLSTIMGISLIYIYPQDAIFIFFAVYVFSGLAAWMWRTVHRTH